MIFAVLSLLAPRASRKKSRRIRSDAAIAGFQKLGVEVLNVKRVRT